MVRFDDGTDGLAEIRIELLLNLELGGQVNAYQEIKFKSECVDFPPLKSLDLSFHIVETPS